MKSNPSLLICTFIATGLFTMATFANSPKGNLDLPKIFAEFEKIPFKGMKELPDVKWSLTQKISPKDIEGKSETEIILMRNSIFAQQGFRFENPAMANYFLSRTWYKPTLQFDPSKVTPLQRQNVEFLMKNQNTRSISSDELSYEKTQVAYNLYRMGFCTYEVAGNPKAGMVVFEPAGNAKVYHSKASAATFEAYAYENYLSPSILDFGKTTLIDATWSVDVQKNIANVVLAFSDEVRKQYLDLEGEPIIAAGKRLLLTLNLNEKDPYSFVQRKSCSMRILK